MNRRSFLSSCLALAAAPAIVRADSLMRIVPSEAACQSALAQEVALANTKFVVAQAGCVNPQMARPPVAQVTPRGR